MLFVVFFQIYLLDPVLDRWREWSANMYGTGNKHDNFGDDNDEY